MDTIRYDMIPLLMTWTLALKIGIYLYSFGMFYHTVDASFRKEKQAPVRLIL